MGHDLGGATQQANDQQLGAAGRRWPLAEASATVTADPAVMRAWRADRQPFYAAVVMLPPARQIEGRRLAVLQALGDSVTASAPGQPHVTISALGTDEAIAQRAQDLLGEEVDMLIQGADTFSSAAFLHASSDAVATLRSRLLREAGPEVGPRRQHVPHVTVGTYCRSIPMAEVRDRLGPLRGLEPMQVRGRASVVQVDRASATGRLLPFDLPCDAR